MRLRTIFTIGTLGVVSAIFAEAQQEFPKVPESLIDDEHVREEFGVNKFTAPSIKQIFASHDAIHPIPFAKTKRAIPEKTPRDRGFLALGTGLLIADGFLIVQTERKFGEIQEVARALLKHADVLGVGKRVTSHSQSLLELSATGDWDKLRRELSKTQQDVEREMVMLRDVDVAHLIAMGGWIRALEISCVAVADKYSDKKAEALARVDVVEYFLQVLECFHPNLQKQEYIQALHKGFTEIGGIMGQAKKAGKELTPDQVESLLGAASLLVRRIEKGE